MRPIQVSVLFGWLGILVTMGCASSPPFPESSLTGKMVEVKIGEFLTPKEITAKPGDEVRWVNTTGGAVDISFVEPLDGLISCQKGFVSTGWGYLFSGETSRGEFLVVATVHGNQYASLCCSRAGTYAYSVKHETGEGRKAGGVAGTVTIE